MRVVSRYAFDKGRELRCIALPKDAHILSVGVMHESINIFVEEDVNSHNNIINGKTDISDLQKVEFAIFKDGRHFDIENYQFLGTILLDFGNTFYHVFYRNV